MFTAMSEMSVGEKKRLTELMDLQVMFSQEDLSQCTFFQNVTMVSLLLPGAKTDICKFAL